jgi:nucleotide-binding universal stress UspA family protein
MAARGIVVGTDGTRSALLAVRRAAELAVAEAAVLHVVAAYAGAPVRAFDAREVLVRTERAIADVGVLTRRHAIAGRPSRALCQIALSERADLIVVGNRGTGSLLRGLQRPVCDRILRRARCPVLVVDTRRCWRTVEGDLPSVAVRHAEPMPIRLDPVGRVGRLYLAGFRVHHGLAGELLVLDGLRRRGRVGLVEAAAGALLLGDDWRDFPFALRES